MPSGGTERPYPLVECPNCGHALDLNPILREYQAEIDRYKRRLERITEPEILRNDGTNIHVQFRGDSW